MRWRPASISTPFFELMANERVLKVFHAARQDIEIVWHRAEHHPAPDLRHPGRRDGARLWRIRSPTTSWSSASPATRSTSRTASPTGPADRCRRRRSPMRSPTSRICATSTPALLADLGRRGRADWMDDEMEVLTSPDTYRAEPERAWMRLKTRVRKPKELAVLIEVAAWREREAQTRDVPRSRVLKDDAIGDIVVQAPTTVGAARGAALAAQGLRALEMGRRHHRGGQARARARPEDAAADRPPERRRRTAPRRSNCSRCCCA